MMWLIKAEVLEAMRDARAMGYEPTHEERREFAAAMKEAYAKTDASLPRNVKLAGNVAQIDIKGALTETPDCMAMLFGGGNTTYASIREGLAAAQADPAIKEIVFNVASPGGTIEGLFETIAAIQATTKPIRSIASLAASAAYALVAEAGPIEAVTDASEFGSIGVAVKFRKDETAVNLASTAAPNKRPDITTEAGQAVVREHLDAVHELFAESIASGRARTTGEAIDAARVNADFGRGGTFLAKEAKSRKMIDKTPRKIQRPSGGKYASAEGGEQENSIMDLATLKASHPAVYAAAFEEGKAAGVAEGIKSGTAEGEKTGKAAELKRIKAHLKMADSTGAHKVAREAIESGASLADEEVMAGYLSAAANRSDQAARQVDTAVVAAATAGAAPVVVATDEPKDIGDAAVEALLAGRPKAVTAAAMAAK